MSVRRVLVTGATGFIGGHLVDRLLADRVSVTALIRRESNLPKRWQGKVTTALCDDWSEARLQQALPDSGYESVFHLAAYGVNPHNRDIGQMIRINTELPAVLARLCHKWQARLVLAGTFSEYLKPASNKPINELSPLEPFKLYGSSKAAGSLLASAVAKDRGVGLRILRLFKVYGSGEASHRLLPTLVSGLSHNQRVAISSGTQVLDFVYIDDVVEALVRADGHIRDRGGISTWNIATGKGHTVRRFAELVAAAMNADPALLGFGEVEMRQDDEPWLVGSPDLLRAELGWLPQTDLETGVRAAVSASMAISET